MNEKIKTLDWIGRCSSSGLKSDVSVRVVHGHDCKKLINITFRNDCFKKFTNSEYCECAIFKNRIFFRESDSTRGLLLNRNKATTDTTTYVRFQKTEYVNLYAQFVGDYELKYDEFYELYYIESKELNTNEN